MFLGPWFGFGTGENLGDTADSSPVDRLAYTMPSWTVSSSFPYGQIKMIAFVLLFWQRRHLHRPRCCCRQLGRAETRNVDVTDGGVGDGQSIQFIVYLVLFSFPSSALRATHFPLLGRDLLLALVFRPSRYHIAFQRSLR